MKTLLLAIALIALGLKAEAQTNSFTTNGCVTIGWNDNGLLTDDADSFFILHHSTNGLVPLEQWEVVAIIQANTNSGKVFFPVGVHYFYLTFSNRWMDGSESPPSNIIGTPQAPMAPTNLRILRLQQTP